MKKNYWFNRKTSAGKLERLKNNKLIAWLFSVRAADALYIKTNLLKFKNSKILDVGCGVGKKQLVDFSEVVYGVDIPGFPSEIAQKKGYKETKTWCEPLYQIQLPEKINLASVICVNAHVSFDNFLAMLNSIEKNMQSEGHIIMINEYDNNSLSYQIMKKNTDKFNLFVSGMEHWHIEYESSFLKKMTTHKPDWEMLDRTILTVNPPFSHYMAFLRISNRLKTTKVFAFFFDLLISFANNLKKIIKKDIDSAFLVGYLVTIQHLDFRLSEIPAIFHLKEVLMPHPHLFCAFCR
jgi:2-polyprenyl-3-methyl-5-hydroxy-6-metoxy-1,4-benzoquinol methylase